MNHGLRYVKWAAVLACLAIAGTAMAFPRFARQTKDACATCHTNAAGGKDLTDAGKAYKADPSKAPASSGEALEYVSNSKCKTCHLKEYKSWQESAHAKALETLKSGDPKKIEAMAAAAGVKLDGPADKNETCLGCHTTGFQLAGGYPAADSLHAANLAGVTCEGCHGPGSKHVAAAKADKKAAINVTVDEVYCRSCHTKEMSPKFDYAEYSKKGLHEKKAAE